jgi:hypothetical protein
MSSPLWEQQCSLSTFILFITALILIYNFLGNIRNRADILEQYRELHCTKKNLQEVNSKLQLSPESIHAQVQASTGDISGHVLPSAYKALPSIY